MKDSVDLYRRLQDMEDRIVRIAGIEWPHNPISPFLALPELRGFWPMSSVNELGTIAEMGGQSRDLTNNGSAPRGVYNSITPYVSLNGSTQYLSRASEAGLTLTGAFTFGGWFFMQRALTVEFLIGKAGASGNFGYFLQKQTAAETTSFAVSGNGTASIGVATANTINAWNFVVGRYTPSTEIAIFNGISKATNTTSVPASLFASTAAFEIGRWSGGPSQFFQGNATLCFMSALSLSDALITSVFQSTRGLFGV